MTRVQEKIPNILRSGFPTQEDMAERKSARAYAVFSMYYGVIA